MFKQIIRTLILIALLSDFALAKDTSFLSPQKYTLGNGITVILQEEHSHPITTIQIYLKGGSINETNRNNGISHVTEHLFFRHYDTNTNASFKDSLEDLGGEFNGETTRDYTCYYVTLPSKNTKQALSLMADAYIHFNFSLKDLENEKKIVLNEYGIYKDNIMGSLVDKLNRLVFGGHPYSMPVIGTENNIKSFTANDINDYISKYYAPSNTTIIIVGDFNTYEIMDLIEELFKNFNSELKNNASQSFLPNTTGAEITEEKDIDNYYFIIGYKTPGIKNYNEIYAVDILTFLIGQGNNCLLINKTINRKKLAEEITASFTTTKDPGLFYITAICKPKAYNGLKKEISNIINDVRAGNFTNEDFERAKNFLIGTYTYTNETNEDKAKTLGFYDTLDDYKFACTYIENIKKMTKNDIIREANILFNAAPYFIAYKPVYIPEENPQKAKIPFPFNLFNW